MATNAHDLITRLFSLIRTTEIYPPGNATLLKTREALMEALQAYLEDEQSTYAVLDRLHDHFVLNQKLVKPDLSTLSQFARFQTKMERLKIRRLVMDRSLTTEDADLFSQAFIHDLNKPGETPSLSTLNRPGLRITLGDIDDEGVSEVVHVENFTEILSKIIVFHAHILNKLTENQPVDSVTIRRMIQEYIGAIRALGVKALVAIPTFADHRELSPHAICQCMLTILFAEHLGYSPTLVQDLGLTTLFAQIGKMIIPESILNKSGDLTDQEREILDGIPLRSLELLLGMKNLSPTGALRLITSYEMGNPGDTPHPFVNILKVISDYEAMIAHKPYRNALHPQEAMTVLLRGRENKYDRQTVNHFVHFLGTWPPGSTGLLDGIPAVVLDRECSAVYNINEWEMRRAMPDKPTPLHLFPVNPASAIHDLALTAEPAEA